MFKCTTYTGNGKNFRTGCKKHDHNQHCFADFDRIDIGQYIFDYKIKLSTLQIFTASLQSLAVLHVPL